MLEIILLIAGIWKALALPGIHRYQPLQFPQLDPEKFDAWKRAELTAAYVFIAATWGALLVGNVVSVWYARQLDDLVATSQISANVAVSRLWNLTIGIAVAWLVGIVIAAAYGSRAKALKKAATLVTPTTGQRREQSPAEAAAASDLWEELEAIARAQRVILWCVLVNLVGFGLSFAFAPAFAEHPELLGIWLLLGIALAVFQAFWVWRLAARLGSGVGILWACGAFVPGLSIILMLNLMGSATTRLKAAGIAVGLMGASLDQFQRPREEVRHGAR